MRRASDYLAAAYVVSGVAGLVCIAIIAAAFVIPGLTLPVSFAVPGVVVAAFLTLAFKFAAIATFRSERGHG